MSPIPMKKRHLPWALWLLFCLALTTSCSPYLKTYQQARDNFNTGASIDNQLKMPLEGQAAVALSPASYYSLSLKFINQSMDKHQAKLRSDGLLLHAFAIKAMSQWKLGQFTQSLRTHQAFFTAFRGQENTLAGQRDFKVLQVFPALVMTDSLNARMALSGDARKQYFEGKAYEKDFENISRAFDLLAEGRGTLSTRDDVYPYLLFSQLAALKVWIDLAGFTDAYANELRDANYRRLATVQMDALRPRRDTCMEALKAMLPDGAQHPTFRYWQFLVGGQ